MNDRRAAPKDFQEYAEGFPKNVQARLRMVRKAIREAAPDATEIISYRMPAFRLGGILVYFGAHARHIGLYPGAAAIATFKRELSDYPSAKGSVQFPLDEPLPLALIARIVKHRVHEEEAKRRKA